MEHTIEGSEIRDEKYVVFKRDEFYHLIDNSSILVGEFDRLEKLILLDATVIRGQDLLAEPLLAAYVGMLAIVIKGGNLSDEERARLLQTADYFHDRAIQAADLGYKLPD